ncbi:MAG: hypothetical protein IPJ45_05930 [Ignavibacteria bacterium]|nr:hypothetical protein [Ignavibacteria bacterium]
MISFISSGDSVYGAITNSSTNGVLPVILYYAIFGIGFYLYSNYKFKNKLIALYCALTATFATDFIQRIVVGHNTKVLALAFFPLILLFLDKLIDSFDDKSKSVFSFQNLINLALLALMLHTTEFKSHSDDILCISDAWNLSSVSDNLQSSKEDTNLGNN